MITRILKDLKKYPRVLQVSISIAFLNLPLIGLLVIVALLGKLDLALLLVKAVCGLGAITVIFSLVSGITNGMIISFASVRPKIENFKHRGFMFWWDVFAHIFYLFACSVIFLI